MEVESNNTTTTTTLICRKTSNVSWGNFEHLQVSGTKVLFLSSVLFIETYLAKKQQKREHSLAFPRH